jgi:Right handed beta helix region
LCTASAVFAQASRTWVSGVGDDANPCSRTAPCKTFAGAISKTASGGEIDALDPGGYGALTITKPITIDGGAFASVLVAGTNGIVVSTAGANDSVTLRNLGFNGIRQTPTAAGLNGIRIVAAHAVHVENCAIFGFSQRGISIEVTAPSSVFVKNTVIRKDGEGIGSFPTGAGSVFLSLSRAYVDENDGHGLNLSFSTSAVIADSTLNGNGTSGMIAWGTSTSVDLDRTMIAGNQYGIYAGYQGGIPVIRIGHSTITGNTLNGIFLNGGSVIGYQNNVIAGNAGNNAVSSTTAQQ